MSLVSYGARVVLPPPAPPRPIPREQKILRFITRSMRGLEVAPYHNPLAPKSGGFNCLTLDIFDFEQLRENARNDPNVRDKIDRIEAVDVVASASELDTALEARGELGTLDYILSSHNFEHLPNPIRFLNACGRALKNEGLLTMAIPNKRFTFDYARPLSSFASVYRAYHENHQQPDPWTLFDFNSSFAEGVPNAPGAAGAPVYAQSLVDSFAALQERLAGKQAESYVDAHVWVFTPESFISIISSCMILQLIPFTLVHIEDAGFEFYVHLRNTGPIGADDAKVLAQRRRGHAAQAFKN